jgi:hypothetical protein
MHKAARKSSAGKMRSGAGPHHFPDRWRQLQAAIVALAWGTLSDFIFDPVQRADLRYEPHRRREILLHRLDDISASMSQESVVRRGIQKEA